MRPTPRVVWMPGGVRIEIHLDGEATGGAFCLLLDELPAGWMLPAHRHRAAAETIHVLEGEFEITVEGDRSRLQAGQTLHVPAGAVHVSENVGSAGGRRIVIFSPAGMEDFFLECGAASPGVERSPAQLLDAASRHGLEFVG
jgi:quercetin dioxygenase-like cupin family protein